MVRQPQNQKAFTQLVRVVRSLIPIPTALERLHSFLPGSASPCATVEDAGRRPCHPQITPGMRLSGLVRTFDGIEKAVEAIMALGCW
jgi:hypothetical protein